MRQKWCGSIWTMERGMDYVFKKEVVGPQIFFKLFRT